MGNLHLQLQLQLQNMAKTERSSILLRMTFVILILAIWIGTTSAGQKCTKKGTKCVDFKDRDTGKSYTKNECADHYTGRGRFKENHPWCATRAPYYGGMTGWNWGCKDCN